MCQQVGMNEATDARWCPMPAVDVAMVQPEVSNLPAPRFVCSFAFGSQNRSTMIHESTQKSQPHINTNHEGRGTNCRGERT